MLSGEEVKLLRIYLKIIEDIVEDKRNKKTHKTARDKYLHLVSEIRKNYNFKSRFGHVSRENPFVSGQGLLGGLGL